MSFLFNEIKPVLIISCEHASKQIPAEYLPLFTEQQPLLDSHRGWDIGAYPLYQAICAKQWAVHQQAGEWSRLLVDLNRSLRNKNLFSILTRFLPINEKFTILKNYYHPYRDLLNSTILAYHAKKIPVLHLSLHSFTPELNGRHRNNDLGLLYDPKRAWEVSFCSDFKATVYAVNSTIKTRLNYPYRGITDSITVSMRRQIPDRYYCGIEIEMNQKHFDSVGNCQTSFMQDIVTAIERIISL